MDDIREAGMSGLSHTMRHVFKEPLRQGDKGMGKARFRMPF